MNSHTAYTIYGPSISLKKMANKLFTDHSPKFLHSRTCDAFITKLDVAVYEDYDKQFNSSITLTCVFESSPDHNKILLKQTGGTMGFGGNSIDDQKTVEKIVVDFILDYSKKFGLTVKEEQVSDIKEEEQT